MFRTSIRYAAALVCAAVISPASAMAEDGVVQSPAILLPGQIAPGDATFAEDSAVLTIPARWLQSVRLAQRVALADGDRDVSLDAGTLMPAVRVGVTDNGQDGRLVFCTRNREVPYPGRERGGLGGFLLGGASFSIYNSLVDGQTCLEDRDQDGRFDNALLLGEGGDGPRDLGAIEPVAFTTLTNELIDPEGDQLRISLRSVRSNSVRLEVNLVKLGTRTLYDKLASGPYETPKFVSIPFGASAREPAVARIFGIRLEVMEANARTGTARIVWAPVALANEMVAVPDQVSVETE